MKAVLAAILLSLPGVSLAGGLQLLVTHDAACGDYARWQRDVAPAYSSMPQGQRAPLLGLAADGPWPDGLVIGPRPRQTPSFLLLENGTEIGRIEGYSDPARFFAQLSALLQGRASPAR